MNIFFFLFILIVNANRPNFVIFLADDQGYGDLSITGHPTILTPNIDKIGYEGIRFTQWYAGSAVCSPSRAALMTGRYPIRSGCQGAKWDGGGDYGVFRADSIGGLHTNETTFAKLLQQNGYNTLMVGKWHLGVKKEYMPLAHGFDEYYGVPYSTDMGTSSYQLNVSFPNEPPIPLMYNNDIIEQPANLDNLTQNYADHVMSFLDKQKNSKEPFLIYMSFNHVHIPNFYNKKFKGKSRRGDFGDSSMEMDNAIGQIMQKMEDNGFDENTVIFYTSDNGPWLKEKLQGGSAGLFYEGKGTTWEGGFRVPSFIRWKSKIEERQISQEMTSTVDIFTTILSLSNIDLPTDRIIDGVDLSPILFKKTYNLNRDCIFLYKGTSYNNTYPGLWAVRCNKYKAHYVSITHIDNTPIFHNPPLLFDLEYDPSELYPLNSSSSYYKNIMTNIQQQVDNHKKTIIPVTNQNG